MQAVCCVPVSPMRSGPGHKNEMVSQLLFGEMVTVIEKTDDFWFKVQCHYDQYEGWVTRNHVTEAAFPSSTYHITSDWSNEVLFNDQPMHLSFGSDLRGLVNGRAE